MGEAGVSSHSAPGLQDLASSQRLHQHPLHTQPLLFADGCCPGPPYLRTMVPTAESADQPLYFSQGGSFWEPGPRKGEGSLQNPGPNWLYPQACWSFWDPSFAKRSFFEFRAPGGELTHVQMMWFDNRSLM